MRPVTDNFICGKDLFGKSTKREKNNKVSVCETD